MIGGFIPGSQPEQLTKKCRDIFYGGTNYCCMIGGFYSRLTAGTIDKKQVGMIINSNLFRLNDQF